MWTTKGVPIARFIERFVDLARREQYEYLLLLIARPADEYALYENLYRDWRSIHELTGSDIMFLFVGPEAARFESAPGFLSRVGRESVLHFSPHIAVAGGAEHARTWCEECLMNQFDLARLTEHVKSPRKFDAIARSHEAQIRDLRVSFGLRETELPALVLISLRDRRRLSATVRGVTSLYPLLQCLVDEIEHLRKLRADLQSMEKPNALGSRAHKSYQRVYRALSSRTLPPGSPLEELKALLDLKHPWDAKQQRERFASLLLRARHDEHSRWFYQSERGPLQQICEFLRQSSDSSALAADPTAGMRDEIASRSESLLERALDTHVALTHRLESGRPDNAPGHIDIFISYSRRDLAKAVALESALRARGYRVWRDEETRAGFSFRREIRSALLSARVVIVIWTMHSIESEWVEWEAATAHRRKRYLPVIDDTISPEHLPAPFGNVHCLSLEDSPAIERHLARTLR